jgi:hypothetical protein
VIVSIGPRSFTIVTIPRAWAAGWSGTPRRFGEKRENLDERDARIAGIEIRPFRRVRRNTSETFVHQLLVAAIVEQRGLEGHGEKGF